MTTPQMRKPSGLGGTGSASRDNSERNRSINGGVSVKPVRRAKAKCLSAAGYRRQLLMRLRRQSETIGCGLFRAELAPDLYELAQHASADHGRRFVSFRGIRFPLKFGIWKYIIDPETGETLVSVSGGWL